MDPIWRRSARANLREENRENYHASATRELVGLTQFHVESGVNERRSERRLASLLSRGCGLPFFVLDTKGHEIYDIHFYVECAILLTTMLVADQAKIQVGIPKLFQRNVLRN